MHGALIRIPTEITGGGWELIKVVFNDHIVCMMVGFIFKPREGGGG